MKMTHSRKLLSVILALAICITTVAGCFLTVTAAGEYYTFANGTVNEDSQTATIDVTFNVPDFENGIYAGNFKIEGVGDSAAALTLTGAVSTTTGITAYQSDESFTYPEIGAVVLEPSEDAEGNIMGAASVTVTLNFTVDGEIVKGNDYQITLDEGGISGKHETDYVDITAGTVGVLSAGCAHVVTIDSESVLVNEDAENGLKLYTNAVCSLCDERFDYQAVPYGDVQVELPDSRKVVYWDGSTKTEPTTDADNDGYLDIDTAEKLAWLAYDLGDKTGKQYKVPSDIKAIVLQTKAYADSTDILNKTNPTDVKTALSTESGRSKWQPAGWGCKYPFAGTFDGNGVTVYGMYSKQSGNYAGLFGTVDMGAVIKNVAVKNSYIEDGDCVGIIAAKSAPNSWSNITLAGEGTVTVQNCIVANNYVATVATTLGKGGVAIGYFDSDNLSVSNCLAYNNYAYNTNLSGNLGFVGKFYYNNQNALNNLITIGNSTFTEYQSNVTYADVYTDTALPTTNKVNVTVVDDAAVFQGTAVKNTCPNFDWATFAPGAAGEYPDFYVEKEYATLKDKAEIVYWDGSTKTKPTTKDSDGNYVISTAEELAYIVSGAEILTDSYIVADGIKAIVLQTKAYADKTDIINKTSAADAFAALSDTSGRSPWVSSEYSNRDKPFQGTFDGNGATIYGFYQKRTNNYAGLFGNVDKGATFKNIAIMNSYIEDGDMTGVLMAYGISDSLNTSVSGGTGDIVVENCIIANNYVRTVATAATKGGVIAGNVYSDNLLISDCLVYGNDAKNTGYSSSDGTGFNLPLVGQHRDVADVNKAENIIALGTSPICKYNFTYGNYYHYGGNSSKNNLFKNVYTDQDINISAWGAPWTYIGKTNMPNITSVTAADITGDAAATNCTALDWGNTWVATNGYPTFAIMVDPVDDKADTALTLAGLNIAYNDGGTLNINFYFDPTELGTTPELYLTDAATYSTIKLEQKADPILPAGAPADALVYAIENISATKIDRLMLPTAIYEGGGAKLWGKTEAISIADYAKSVINGNAFYGDGTDPAIVTADKKVAAAMINYGALAADALASTYDGTPSTKTKVLYWNGDYTEPTDTNGDGIYDIDAASDIAWLASKTQDEKYDSKGKTYKVADNIKAFVMQPQALSAIKDKTSAADVKAFFDANAASAKVWNVIGYNGQYPFQGTFDGNGVTIYGMYNDWASYTTWQKDLYGGLFGLVDNGAVIRNVSIENSHFTTVNGMVGTIFGATASDAWNAIAANKGTGNVTVENCIATNNYIRSADNAGHTRAGVMVGQSISDYLQMNNCFAYDNDAQNTAWTTPDGEVFNLPLIGTTANTAGAYNIKNVIAIGTTPYNKYDFGWNVLWHNDGQGSATTYFDNVYTDQPTGYLKMYSSGTNEITQYSSAYIEGLVSVTTDDIKGEAAQASCDLDWENTWLVGLGYEYPSLLMGMELKTQPLDKTEVLYWHGDFTKPTDDDGDGIYDIDEASDIAYLASRTQAEKYDSKGKTYKVVDGIKAFVMQPESLRAIQNQTSAADVKAFFDDNAEFANVWQVVGYNGQYPFQGTFDGNGVTVYGMYNDWATKTDSTKDLYGGLFGLVDNGAVIRNVSVENSHFTTVGGMVGAIFANVANDGWNAIAANKGTGDVTVENCIAANNYIRATEATTYSKAGVMVGQCTQDYLQMNNCLAYGNDAQQTGWSTPDGATFYLPLIGGLSGTSGVHNVQNVIALGTTPYNKYDFGWALYHHNNGQGTGTTFFDNVYTDQPTANFNMYNGTTLQNLYASKAMEGLVSITANDIMGEAAKSAVPTFGWVENGGAWYTGNMWGGYPALNEPSPYPEVAAADYDAMVIDLFNDYGVSTSEFGVYSTTLNLKANPYIAFTFAFHGEYKTNRDNIAVTFTTDSGYTVTTTVGNGAGGVNTGWTNNEGAGRYHLYRLKDVPIEDLAKPITVSVSYGGNTYDFGSYSVAGFANELARANMLDYCSYYTTRYDAAKALLFYIKMVNARYGA